MTVEAAMQSVNDAAVVDAEWPEVEAPAASPIVRYNATEAGLAELRSRLQSVVYDVRTTKGMDEARRDRRECVTLRVDLEKARTDEKADIVVRGRLIDNEAKRIREAIEAVETPIDEQIKAEEKRKADEKAAREAAAAAIQKRIDWIRLCVTQAVGKTAQEIEEFAATLAGAPIDESLYGERVQEATDERTAALTKLQDMRQAAAAQENETIRLAAEREAFEAEQRAARATREREDRERADRNAAEDAERKKKQDELDRQAKVKRDEEDRIAREARAAEQKVLDNAAAELRRQQQAADDRRRADEEATRELARKAEEALATKRREERAALEAAADPWAALKEVDRIANSAETTDSRLDDIIAAVKNVLDAKSAFEKYLDADQAELKG